MKAVMPKKQTNRKKGNTKMYIILIFNRLCVRIPLMARCDKVYYDFMHYILTAAGLFYIAELVEEYSVLTGKVIKYLITVSILIGI
jgi:hypothetical protein